MTLVPSDASFLGLVPEETRALYSDGKKFILGYRKNDRCLALKQRLDDKQLGFLEQIFPGTIENICY
jgi:hypothetical protein